MAQILKRAVTLLALALWGVAGPLYAQRVQFPSMISTDAAGVNGDAPAAAPTSIPTAPPLSSLTAPERPPAPPPTVLAQVSNPYGAPATSPAPLTPPAYSTPPGYAVPSAAPATTPPPYTSPNYTAPNNTAPAPASAVAPAPVTPYASPNPYPAGTAPATFPAAPWPGAGGPAPPAVYGATPVPGAAPTATLPGGILPPPSWDPYAAPGPQQPSLLPQNPFLAVPGAVCPPPVAPQVPMTRLVQEIRGDYLWMVGNSATDFGYNQGEISGTMAFPLFFNVENPILVTPGLTTYFLNRPIGDIGAFYDAYLDGAWNPQFTPFLGAELDFRVGVYSDFTRVTSESIRYTGHGLGVVALSPDLKIKGGIVYLDRLYIKMLPAGGVVWTPNADWRFDILFPNPKVSARVLTYGITDWWLYGRGEYGGDDWTTALNGGHRIDYNDIRAAVGLEFNRHGGINGLVEAGVAFDREIRTVPGGGPPAIRPDTTVFVHGSIAF